MFGSGTAEERNEAAPFGALLAALALMILLMPFAAHERGQAAMLRGLLTLVLLTGVFASSRNRVVLGVSILLAASASATGWVADFGNVQEVAIASWFLALVNIAFVGAVVASTVLTRERVTADAIFGGLSVFLMIGVAFMIIYGLVEYFQPGSFLLQGEPIRGGQSLTRSADSFSVFMYLSFITLATVGYGDIYPVLPLAQVLCATEGILGQLFLAVVVARLIGMSLASRQERERH